jgi:hypothetical protein
VNVAEVKEDALPGAWGERQLGCASAAWDDR